MFSNRKQGTKYVPNILIVPTYNVLLKLCLTELFLSQAMSYEGNMTKLTDGLPNCFTNECEL